MSYLRKMKTTNESRAVESTTEQGVKVRASRNLNNLVNAWDDKPHSRCGKHGRNNRYKNHR